MKKTKLNFILLVLLVPLLTFCSGVRDAFEGNKRSDQSDEFLVKKKNPLQMPPDMNKLPKPGNNLEVKSQQNNEEVKDLLKIKDDDNSEDSSNGSDLLNNMKKKINQIQYLYSKLNKYLKIDLYKNQLVLHYLKYLEYKFLIAYLK